MPRVLVVEDEQKVLRGLTQGLQSAGYDVEAAATGVDGARLSRSERFDAVVLDWMLPGKDGLDVLRELRSTDLSTPVLILTARDAIDDRVTGLDAGADDYLVKPPTRHAPPRPDGAGDSASSGLPRN
jgi:DNA-binding response OmpR family regulator